MTLFVKLKMSATFNKSSTMLQPQNGGGGGGGGGRHPHFGKLMVALSMNTLLERLSLSSANNACIKSIFFTWTSRTRRIQPRPKKLQIFGVLEYDIGSSSQHIFESYPVYCRTHNVSVCLYIAYIACGSASLYIKILYVFFYCTGAVSGSYRR